MGAFGISIPDAGMLIFLVPTLTIGIASLSAMPNGMPRPKHSFVWMAGTSLPFGSAKRQIRPHCQRHSWPTLEKRQQAVTLIAKFKKEKAVSRVRNSLD